MFLLLHDIHHNNQLPVYTMRLCGGAPIGSCCHRHANKPEQCAPAGDGSKPNEGVPKIDRPELKQNVDDEKWQSFEAEWHRFKRCTAMSPDKVADQLF